MWRHGNQMPTAPRQLVVQLAMVRFRPDFCFTCLPWVSVLPLLDLDIFRICKSSMHTIAWFWLTLAFAFFQFWLNFTFRAIRRWYFTNRCWCFLKLLSGSRWLPSDNVTKRAMPISSPTMPPVGCFLAQLLSASEY